MFIPLARSHFFSFAFSPSSTSRQDGSTRGQGCQGVSTDWAVPKFTQPRMQHKQKDRPKAVSRKICDKRIKPEPSQPQTIDCSKTKSQDRLRSTCYAPLSPNRQRSTSIVAIWLVTDPHSLVI